MVGHLPFLPPSLSTYLEGWPCAACVYQGNDGELEPLGQGEETQGRTVASGGRHAVVGGLRRDERRERDGGSGDFQIKR